MNLFEYVTFKMNGRGYHLVFTILAVLFYSMFAIEGGAVVLSRIRNRFIITESSIAAPSCDGIKLHSKQQLQAPLLVRCPSFINAKCRSWSDS